MHTYVYTYIHTDRQTDRQTETERERDTYIQTYIHLTMTEVNAPCVCVCVCVCVRERERERERESVCVCVYLGRAALDQDSGGCVLLSSLEYFDLNLQYVTYAHYLCYIDIYIYKQCMTAVSASS